MLDSIFNSIFGSLIEWSPLGTLLFISFLMSLIVTLIYKWATDQELMKSLKAEIKQLQKDMKEFMNDPEKSLQIRKQLNEKAMKQFKSGLKPTLYTFVPFIILFSWLKNVYGEMGALIIGLSWLWVYIISSLVFGMVLRKLFKVH